MHMATVMYDAIIENPKNKKLLKDRFGYKKPQLAHNRRLVRLAALLHDVGHGPFSHVAERVMPFNDKERKPFKHEDYTFAILRQSPLRDVIEKNDVGIDVEQIVELFEATEENMLWKEIISSQLDADRGDYLLRDSHHIGVQYGVYDYPRLLNTLALGYDPETGDIETGELKLGIFEDGLRVAESFIIARYLILTQVALHKTRRAFDYHLEQAMKEILPSSKLPKPSRIERYLGYDDYVVLNKIRRKKDKSEDCKAILDRRQIRPVYEKEIISKKTEPQEGQRVEESFSEEEERIREEKKEVEEVSELLKRKRIWVHLDDVEKSWYDIDATEILVTSNHGEVGLLSDRSNIMKNMGPFKAWRLYVKPEAKKKADYAIRRWRETHV